VILDERAAQPDDRLGLVPEEPRRADQGLELEGVGRREVLRGAVAGEQGRGDLVDPLVGALRGEDRRDEELERVLWESSVSDSG